VNPTVATMAHRIPDDAGPIIVLYGQGEQTGMLFVGVQLEALPEWLVKFARELTAKLAVNEGLARFKHN
jgi:hypothetical protein